MAAPIDPAVIAALDELSDDGSFFDEMLDVFLKDLAPSLDVLTRARGAGDVETLFKGAHRLKSGSANVGAMRVNRACIAIETPARAGDFAKAAAGMAELLDAVDEVRTWANRRKLAPTGTG